MMSHIIMCIEGRCHASPLACSERRLSSSMPTSLVNRSNRCNPSPVFVFTCFMWKKLCLSGAQRVEVWVCIQWECVDGCHCHLSYIAEHSIISVLSLDIIMSTVDSGLCFFVDIWRHKSFDKVIYRTQLLFVILTSINIRLTINDWRLTIDDWRYAIPKSYCWCIVITYCWWLHLHVCVEVHLKYVEFQI